ncbi:uncharacterized protein LOC9651498 isoform X1 [Selaginella moellendorffii]|uniref:uncharacterized protein LOC9651498 isoform X1 n=1 Tax=Selaginella moellendorffii TaxID=88036 RepID=UPI000D1C9ACE|nr:uncharacterized protein LOC9651498 isoform X1 [Selaginella moellendorffii]|eukprot:XP_024529329.1 uncharacterized protein LOC9651498 isoform X1 [Selaginella moellendorffii]
MSKKKAMPRSTMSLKVFHGGSIPSDLQLPSAPGMTVDRSAYERPSSANVWSSASNPMSKGYGNHRQALLPNGETRPSSAAAAPSSSYFPNTATMGRNYDEDERRPVDFRPRTSPGGHHDYRSREYDNGGGVYFKGRLSRSPDHLRYSAYPPGGGDRFGPPLQPSMAGSPERPPVNAWAARRGERLEPDASATSPWRVRNSMARIAEASAIDKVSSGRWQPAATPRKEPLYDVDARKVDISHAIEQQEVEDGRRVDSYHHTSWKQQPAEATPEGGYRSRFNDAGDTSERARFEYDHFERGDSFRGVNEQSYHSFQEDRVAGHGSTSAYDCLEVHYTQGDDGRHSADAQASQKQQHLSDSRHGPGARQHPANVFERQSTDSNVVNHERLQRQRSFDSERNRTSATAVNHEFNHQSSAHVSTMVGSTYSDSTKTGAALLRSTSGERPKLKLLPRSKPMEDRHDFFEDEGTFLSEADRAGRQQHASERETHDSRPVVTPSAQTEHDTCPTSERPKLSLKPRTQAPDNASDKERYVEDAATLPWNSCVFWIQAKFVRWCAPQRDGASTAWSRRHSSRSRCKVSIFLFPCHRADMKACSDVAELIRKERWQPVETRQQQGRTNNEGGKVVNRREEDPIRSEADRYEIRRDLSRQDRRDHRDIDRQESWRRRAEPTPALSALAEMPSRVAGKSSLGSSALQLAQAFSRSTISAAGSRLTDTPSPRYGRASSGQQQRKHSAATAW